MKDLRVMGRSTQGVRLVNLTNDDKVVAIQKIEDISGDKVVPVQKIEDIAGGVK